MKSDKVFIDRYRILNWIPENPSGNVEGTQRSVDLMVNLLDEHGEMNILVDLSKADRPTAEQRKVIVNALRSYLKKIKKVAIFGQTPLMKAVSYFIIHAAGYSNTRFFDSRNKAEAWLREA